MLVYLLFHAISTELYWSISSLELQNNQLKQALYIFILPYLLGLWKESMMLYQMIGLLCKIEPISTGIERQSMKQSLFLGTMGLKCSSIVSTFCESFKKELLFLKDVYKKDICLHPLHLFQLGQNIAVVRNMPRARHIWSMKDEL